jgi:hypothetical protein
MIHNENAPIQVMQDLCRYLRFHLANREAFPDFDRSTNMGAEKRVKFSSFSFEAIRAMDG